MRGTERLVSGAPLGPSGFQYKKLGASARTSVSGLFGRACAADRLHSYLSSLVLTFPPNQGCPFMTLQGRGRWVATDPVRDGSGIQWLVIAQLRFFVSDFSPVKHLGKANLAQGCHSSHLRIPGQMDLLCAQNQHLRLCDSHNTALEALSLPYTACRLPEAEPGHTVPLLK